MKTWASLWISSETHILPDSATDSLQDSPHNATGAVNRESRLLDTDEAVEFEKYHLKIH